MGIRKSPLFKTDFAVFVGLCPLFRVKNQKKLKFFEKFLTLFPTFGTSYYYLCTCKMKGTTPFGSMKSNK